MDFIEIVDRRLSETDPDSEEIVRLLNLKQKLIIRALRRFKGKLHVHGR